MPNTRHLPAREILSCLASRPQTEPTWVWPDHNPAIGLTASEVANVANMMSQAQPVYPLPTEMPASDKWYVSLSLNGKPKLQRGPYGAPSIQAAKDEYVNELKGYIRNGFKKINDNMSNIERNRQVMRLTQELTEGSAQESAEPASQQSVTGEVICSSNDNMQH